MALNANSIVAIVELVAYVPAIIVSFMVCLRHGFHRSSGWLYTLALCLIRIIGAACQLATIPNPDDVPLITASVILENIGVTPLLLATLGMLSRLVDWTNRQNPSPTITIYHFRLVQLLILLNTILSIVGGTDNNATPTSPATESQVAAVFYVVTYAALLLILLVSARSRSLVPADERLIVPAVALALVPFIAVRVLYSLLVVFVHSGAFARIGGPAAARLCMATVEEFVVVAVYLFLGYRLARLDESERGEILSRPRYQQPSRSGPSSYDPEQGQGVSGVGEEYGLAQGHEGTGGGYPSSR
ncbi:hypothetical protein C8A01DRAFT_50648 [Parachaetomium inaequale]|uniref:DUF7702 domain-containing protein n=1 Tax=Parachaetomium inaequale TaxID=2588326 RepID=A0AAN6P6A9_9PEZI|nr:hypothetical protein C8A01DRAFT_50648 [Parachaetomium inaequale]